MAEAGGCGLADVGYVVTDELFFYEGFAVVEG